MTSTRLILAFVLTMAGCGGSVDATSQNTSQDEPHPDGSFAGAAGAPGTGGMPGSAGQGGSCAHDCLGGECHAGACQPVQIGQATSFAAWLTRIYVDGTHLFFVGGAGSAGTTIAKMPKQGGGLEEILQSVDTKSVVAVALLGDSVYVQVQGSTNSVIRVPKAGGPTLVIWQGESYSYPQSLTAGAESLFFGMHAVDKIRLTRLHVNDGATEVITEVPGEFVTSISSDDAFLYASIIASGSLESLIYRAPKQGGDAELLVQGGGLSNVIPVGADLYYVHRDQNADAFNRLMRLPKNGGTSVVVVDEAPGISVEPAGFDLQHVWWIRREGAYSDTIQVMKTQVAGGPGSALTTDSIESTTATDQDCIYWVRESGEVMRMVR